MTPSTTPALALLRRLLHPDDLGHAVSPEVRRLAAAALRADLLPEPPRPSLYLSGPMTGLPDLNFPAFHAEAARLRRAGWHVVNPAELNTNPLLTWKQCLRVDLREMLTCSAVAHLPGWQRSDGAHLETYVAHRVGLDILTASEIRT